MTALIDAVFTFSRLGYHDTELTPYAKDHKREDYQRMRNIQEEHLF